MAGSYDHLVDDDGKFQGVELLDDLGDAYQALEECFGMIWFLANGDAGRVVYAWRHWRDGFNMSPGYGEMQDVD